MEGIFVWIMIFTVLFVFILFWPMLKRFSPELSDTLFRLRSDFGEIKGDKRAWRFIVTQFEPVLSPKIVSKLDRLLKLSGRPLGVSAQELMLMYVGLFLVSSLLATSLRNGGIQAWFVFGFGLPFYHIRLLYSRKIRRQIVAEEAIRFLKRRFVYLLLQRIPINEALQSIAAVAPGEFGETFQKILAEGKEANKPLRVVMTQLREEYEVRSLDDFCLAIEISDLKSPEILADLIYKQTMNENARLDDFIEKKKESTKGKMVLIVALAAAWTIALTVIFGAVSFMDFFNGGGGFLRF